jgi:hypothetical protein
MKIGQFSAALVAAGLLVAGPAIAQTSSQTKAPMTAQQTPPHKQPTAGGGGGGGGTNNPLPGGATKQQTAGGGGGGGGTDNPLPAGGASIKR